MNQKQITKTFISVYGDLKLKKPFSLHGLNKNNS